MPPQTATSGIVEATDDAVEIGDRRNLGDVFGADNLCFQPHVAMLGTFRDEHVKAVFVVGKGDAADMVEAA